MHLDSVKMEGTKECFKFNKETWLLKSQYINSFIHGFKCGYNIICTVE